MGEMGTFKLEPGTRDIRTMTVAGSLYSPEHAVAIGYNDGKREPVNQCKVPVGNYTIYYTRIGYGPLDITISNNYHSDGKRQDWLHKERKLAVQISKDKPFVLDFSNKPEVLFAGPAKDSVFKPGDEVQVYAVLVDPVLDIMIRGVNDNRQKAILEIDFGDGEKETRETDNSKSLDPVVTIIDSSGKTVAEGTMPFG